MKVAAVSYFWPDFDKHDSKWARLAAAAPLCDLVLASPNLRRGAAPEKAYAAQMARQRKAGQKVLVYTTMNHRDKHNVQNDGVRRAAPFEVLAAVDRAYVNYPRLFNGMFIDEMDNDGTPASVAYVATVGAHIRKRGGIACFNPGTTFPASYLPHGDLFMVFEGTPAMYFKRKPARFEATHGHKMWHAVHSARVTDIPKIIAQARVQGPAYLSVNFDNDSYSNLPPAWEQEFLSQVRGAGPMSGSTSSTLLVVGAAVVLIARVTRTK